MNTTRELLNDLDILKKNADMLGVTEYIESKYLTSFLSCECKDIFYNDVLDLKNILHLFKEFLKDHYKEGEDVMLPIPSNTPIQSYRGLLDYNWLIEYIYMSIRTDNFRDLTPSEEKRFEEAKNEAVHLSTSEEVIEFLEEKSYEYSMNSLKNDSLDNSFFDKITPKKKLPPKRHLKKATKSKMKIKEEWNISEKARYIYLNKEKKRKNSDWKGGLSCEC